MFGNDVISFIMKEEETKKSRIISLQLKEKIKKKPYAQQIGPTRYIYSLLNKKNEVFFLTNERLLLLIGNTSIGYARSIPEHTSLPFHHQQNLPPLKYNILLSAISSVTSQADHLKICFVPESKLSTWEFVCDSKQVAQQWKEAIQDAVSLFQLSTANQPLVVKISQQALNSQSQKPAVITQQAAPVQQINQPVLSAPFALPAQLPHQKDDAPVTNQIAQSSEINKLESEMPAVNASFSPQANEVKPMMEQAKLTSDDNPLGLKEKGSWTVESQLPSQAAHDYQLKKISEERQKELLKLDTQQQNQKMQNRFMPDWQQARTAQRKSSDCHWDYEFLKAQDDYLVIQKFKLHVEPIVMEIIDQQPLKAELRKYRPFEQSTNSLKYSIDGIHLHISLLEPAENSSFHGNSTTVSSSHTKAVRAQFKNANYILQCSRNKGRLRVPLMMIVNYKGFQVLAKAGIHTVSEYVAPASTLQQDIVQLQQTTRVNRDIFQEEENLKVIAGDCRWFEKINRSQNQMKRFDCCFLTDIHHFIPQDLYSNQPKEAYLQLRPELMQDDTFEGILLTGGDLLGATNKFRVANQTKTAINLLGDVSATIQTKIAVLVQDFQNLEVSFTNSQELSAAMHLCGVNIRYLGSMLNLSKAPWLSSILESQIVARSAKYILNYELQETAINLAVDSIQKAREFQINQVVSWLNRILGVGPQSEGIWSQIIRQAQAYFKASVRRENLNLGFLLQGLQYHGNFRVRWEAKKISLFKSNHNFERADFLQFKSKCTVYDPSYTNHYAAILDRLETLSFQNYEYLAGMLNITKRNSLQSHYFLNSTGEQLIVYLANWLSPQQAPFLYNYSMWSLPNRYYYELQLIAIKWELKAGHLQQAEKIRDRFVEHINLWLGESHPIMAELYDIFTRYYLNEEDQLRNALAYARSALVNQQQLLGSKHFKLADAYYSLGDTQLQFSRRNEALSSYRKAKLIIQENNQIDSQAFIEICLKVSQVLLLSNNCEEAVSNAKQALTIAQSLNLKEQYLSAAETLSRCYEVSNDWVEYSKLVHQLISTLSLFSQSFSSFQSILKVIFLPALRALVRRSKETAQSLQALLKTLPQLMMNQYDAFGYLKRKIEERSFPWSLIEYLDEAERVIGQAEIGGVGRRWRGFQSGVRQSRGSDFVGQLEALRLVIGRGFIEAILDNE